MTVDQKMIPDEVWDAFHEACKKYGYGPHAIAAALSAWPGAERALYRHDYPNREVWSFDAMTPEAQDKWIRKARAAFEAMVQAWPKWLDMDADPGAALILPLTETSTKENDNG